MSRNLKPVLVLCDIKFQDDNLPMNFAHILEQTKSNGMNRCITPSLIKETTGSVEKIEIILVCLTPPEIHIRNLEIGPEMAG